MRRIKEQCYDKMKDKLQIVHGIKCNETVTTFPILQNNKNDELINKKIQFLRKMNIIEQEWSNKTQDRIPKEFNMKHYINNKSIKYIWDINEININNKSVSEKSEEKKNDKKKENNNDRIKFAVSKELK
eukprot:230038_1